MITSHALQRTKDRTGLNMKSSERFIVNAIERGLSAENFPTKEREFLRRQESKQGCRTVVYNDYCFIISEGDYCITMYSVPMWFGKKKYFDGKQKIKDVKKYMRFYNSYEEEGVEHGFCKIS